MYSPGAEPPGVPHLVILPGLDATGTQHAAFCAALREHGVASTVIAYPVDRPLGYAALEAFVRQALPATQDYVLLGESFSGPLALAIAAQPPPRLRGMVLSTTFARSPWRALRAAQAALYRAPVRLLPMPILSWWLLGRWSTPALRAALAAALARVDADVLRTRAAAVLGVDHTVYATRVVLPSLCLHARNDRLLPGHCQRHLSRLLPAQCVRWFDGPHLLLQTRPQVAAAEVAAFVHSLT
ncbi:MAG: alpha/beta fold hydrolase [Stenotrophomonas sp.]|uniref:alpha/beta fold hydrolase n=1 Tax=Stenotrophomonas sp. TaxID=69392 RepID=UPI003D6C8BA5